MIRTAADVTAAVLREAERTSDPRLREVLSAGLRHLHAFATEVGLTEREFNVFCDRVARAGQLCTPSHNEVRLLAGVTGLSSLVCLLNNGADGGGTTASLMGPFWRRGAPATASGGSIVRSPTPGDPLFVEAVVRDPQGRPVAGADVDVWQASNEGYYENQDPQQADMNLRGRFVTDDAGRFRLRTVMPQGYPVPVDGPVGDLLRAQGRHNFRPAHLHFLVHKDGFKPQFCQVFVPGDPHLDTDAVFAVTEALIGRFVRHEVDPAPDADVRGPWYSLDQALVIEPGGSALPPPPISGKADGGRPAIEVLHRRP